MWTVTKDVDELKVAIVYPGGLELKWAMSALKADHPIITPAARYTEKDAKGFLNEAKELQKIVKDVLPSIKLFDFKDLLQETLDEYRDDKTTLKNIVSTCFGWDWPRIEKLLGDLWKYLTASQIIGQDCPILKHGDGFKIGIRPVTNIISIADMGHMTSKGFILSNKQSWWRSREEEIMKAILEHHPVMKENVHLLLDMGTKNGCYLEGGDCCAISDDSTAIAIGWQTYREGAIEVSKALPNQTIYAVHKYPIELGSGGGSSLLWHYAWHLNGMFTMVDENKVLCTPYIFDWPKGGRKWLIKLLETLRKDFEKWEPLRKESNIRKYREAGKKIPEWLVDYIFGPFRKEKIDAIKDVGTVEIYKNGKRVAVKDSFLDALIEDEILEPDNIIYVGGDPNDIDYKTEYEHYVTALREGIWACSVATLKPGKVIAYHDMIKTNEALEYHGVKPVRIDGRYMRKVGLFGLDSAILPLWRK